MLLRINKAPLLHSLTGPLGDPGFEGLPGQTGDTGSPGLTGPPGEPGTSSFEKGDCCTS